MKLFNNISALRYSPSRAILVLAATLILGACASQNQSTFSKNLPPLQHNGPAYEVADVDLLEVTPEMDEFLERYVTRYEDRRTRMLLLVEAVSKNGPLGFDYDETLTLTSADAFEKRGGNCIAYANLIVALARRVGLKAYYQEVFRERDWSNREDAVLLIKHINVVIASNPHHSSTVDISGIDIGPSVRQKTIEDSYAKALYLNNLGVELMLNNNLPAAYAYFDKAIDEQPRVIDSWVNVGVAFGRNNQLNDAEFAFQAALEIDHSEYSAMSNLYEVYIAKEDLQAARNIEEQVEKHRRGNPYYLLRLSDEAVENNQFEESISLLRRAIRKKGNDHELHFALAKTQYLTGNTKAAENSLDRAREVAPENMLAVYDQPMNELMSDY